MDGASSKDQAAPDRPMPRMADQGKLAQDWITVWQSEFSALAADPEVLEAWRTLMALWARTISTLVCGLPDITHHDAPYGRASAADASRSAPVAAAPDARDAEIRRLAQQVGDLERRLAELERGRDLPVHGKVRTRRKPRS